tara:strand:+ start:262 stop:612 length:351 start_codon:yes stop_codon:yes gene_type:complete
MSKIAVIRIRGMINVNQKASRTLELLKLNKKHACAIVNDTPSLRGMMNIVKDFVTWGEISEDTIKLLNDKKGEGTLFSLHPPRGGFERKGIKTSFQSGGALGYRVDKINDLIQKMI